MNLAALINDIPQCMLCDQRRLRTWAANLAQAIRQRRAADLQLQRLTEQIQASRRQRDLRLSQLPKPTYPPDLPIAQKRTEIADAIAAHQVVILCGETGSGKTTQLPKICLDMGRGVAGLIGHTQPRRIAARTVANRIAQELRSPLGLHVGYKVRFSETLQPSANIKLMTDGILLAETQNDRLLEQYDTLIIDEAHERSLNIDFLLGYLHQLLPQRPDLKLIITSATIDPQRFAKHFHNAPVIEVSGRTYPVETRYHPILVTEDDDEEDPSVLQAILNAVDELVEMGPGDILIFLSGEREIRETAEALHEHLPHSGRGGVEVLPLYARLSIDEQNKIFANRRGGHRRIVLATNVAETSLTVPGIHYVIDPGLARISRYSARSKTGGGVQRLPIEKISQASANQRKGRCGRVAEGVCIRLYSEDDFLARSLFTEPEILRTNLASVILQMLALRLGTTDAFPFLDPPDPRQVRDGYSTLYELGAIAPTTGYQPSVGSNQSPTPPSISEVQLSDSSVPTHLVLNVNTQLTSASAPKSNGGVWVTTSTIPTEPTINKPKAKTETPFSSKRLDPATVPPAAWTLTPLGRNLAKLPLDPRIGRMILAGSAENCLSEVLIVAAALSVQDPRERPIDAQAQADESHLKFRDESSDFLAFLKLWAWYHQHAKTLSSNQLRKFCQTHFVSWIRMREWIDTHRQLVELATELKLMASSSTPTPSPRRHQNSSHSRPASQENPLTNLNPDALHRALLTGLLANVGFRSEGHEYTGARGRKFHIHPSSALFKHKPDWLMAAEMVETTRLFARTVAPVRISWIEKLAPHLIDYAHSELRWQRDRGHVEADERVSLFGMVLVPKRSIHYGPVNPPAAREIFLRYALLENDLPSVTANAPFARHNRGLLEKVLLLQNKARRHDLLADIQTRYEFFAKQVPDHINSIQRFDQWRRQAQRHNPQILHMTFVDILRPNAEIPSESDFPDTLTLGDSVLPLTYHFDPDASDDGITLTIPLALLAQLRPEPFTWLVPGMLHDKITALLKSLPSATRRYFVPVPQFAKAAYDALMPPNSQVGPWPPQSASLTDALAATLSTLTGIDIPPTDWRPDALLNHLHMNFRIISDTGFELASGRDLIALQQKLAPQITGSFSKVDHPLFTRNNLTSWDQLEQTGVPDPLPERIEFHRHGMSLVGYPALTPTINDDAFALVDQRKKSSAKIDTLPSSAALTDTTLGVDLRLFDTPEAAGQAHRRGLIRLFILSLEPTFRRLAHYLPEKDLIYTHYAILGPASQLRDDILAAITDRALFSDLTSSASANVATVATTLTLDNLSLDLLAPPAAPYRSRIAFNARRQAARPYLHTLATQVTGLVREILELYHAITLDLERPKWRLSADWTLPLDDIQQQLQLLLPRHFVITTPYEWLMHFPRYLQAIQIRLQKLSAGHVQRDLRHLDTLTPLYQRYHQRLEHHRTLNLLDPELVLYRFLLEELRVSLFAQELATAFPVSAKRLEKQFEKVRV